MCFALSILIVVQIYENKVKVSSKSYGILMSQSQRERFLGNKVRIKLIYVAESRQNPYLCGENKCAMVLHIKEERGRINRPIKTLWRKLIKRS